MVCVQVDHALGITTEESVELKRLKRENAESRRANAIFGAIEQGHLLAGVRRRKAVLRASPFARPALSTHRTPVENYEVARLNRIDTCPNTFHRPGSCLNAPTGTGTRR
jgi:hypothetical protein